VSSKTPWPLTFESRSSTLNPPIHLKRADRYSRREQITIQNHQTMPSLNNLAKIPISDVYKVISPKPLKLSFNPLRKSSKISSVNVKVTPEDNAKWIFVSQNTEITARQKTGT
jgi:hypothetical protein